MQDPVWASWISRIVPVLAPAIATAESAIPKPANVTVQGCRIALKMRHAMPRAVATALGSSVALETLCRNYVNVPSVNPMTVEKACWILIPANVNAR